MNVLLNNNDYIVKKSIDSYDSTQKPFFSTNVDNNDNNDDNNNDNINLNTLLNILNEQNADENLVALYKYYKNVNNELYINNWSFMSINKMLELHNSYAKDNIYIHDIAFTYLGMGWIKILFYDKNKKKYFLRRDGGSNGYDRENNYECLKNYCNNNNNNNNNNDNIIIESFNNLEEFFIYIKNN